jgi:cell fate regulator YaaT (PSP1 superfamily)
MEEQLLRVRLRENKKSKRYLYTLDRELSPGDWVIVPDEEEEDLGVVTRKPIPLPVEWEDVELPQVLDFPAEEEIEKARKLREEREPEAIKKAYEKVREHNLDMKLIQARYYHRSNKMKFHFSAENRVDFRELVRDLATLFHARIEMRQIGVRDAAGMVGGYGPCGQELCCSRFLTGFDPITIRMAKDQNLALNPSKISGCCGRLLCCLKYEHETYVEARRYFPKNGTPARLGELPARVSGFNILKSTVTLVAEGQMAEIPLEDFKRDNRDWRGPAGAGPVVKPAPAAVAEPEPEADEEQLVSLEDPQPPEGAEESAGGNRRRRRRRRRKE